MQMRRGRVLQALAMLADEALPPDLRRARLAKAA